MPRNIIDTLSKYAFTGTVLMPVTKPSPLIKVTKG